MSQLAEVARRAVEQYLGVKTGEQVVIFIDTLTSPSIPVALATQILAVGAEPIILTIAPRRSSGQDVPDAVLAAVAAADVVISAASRSPYHSRMKTVAQTNGTRGTLNAPPSEAGWVAGAMTADFSKLRGPAGTLRSILSNGSLAHVSSPAGTDISMSIAGREPVGWLCGIATEPGQIVAWPGGEVSLPPVEGSAEGTVVVEVAMTDIGAIRTPVTWLVKAGLVVKISGGQEAALLEEHVAGVRNATNIGELGIGINPSARLVDDITEAKKRRGTAHIAMGDSANGYGGTVDSPVHIDGLIRDVTIEIDGVQVVKNGLLKF